MTKKITLADIIVIPSSSSDKEDIDDKDLFNYSKKPSILKDNNVVSSKPLKRRLDAVKELETPQKDSPIRKNIKINLSQSSEQLSDDLSPLKGFVSLNNAKDSVKNGYFNQFKIKDVDEIKVAPTEKYIVNYKRGGFRGRGRGRGPFFKRGKRS
ncbi:hypothetical protein MP638_003561 [Amoeboaphelidium occidentale]|nr:hypothetical protein MP638_003561 [Amoeboaphelidium occidentale]